MAPVDVLLAHGLRKPREAPEVLGWALFVVLRESISQGHEPRHHRRRLVGERLFQQVFEGVQILKERERRRSGTADGVRPALHANALVEGPGGTGTAP